MNIIKSFSAVLAISLFTGSAHAAKFFVSFKDSAPAQEFKTLIVNQKSLNIRLKDDLTLVKSFIVEARDKSQIQKLVKRSDINFIDQQATFAAPKIQILPTPSTGFSRMSLMSADLPVSQGLQLIKAPQVWPMSRGAGARVMIIDTGIDPNHPAFQGRIEKVKNFTGVGAESDVTDDEGHGTHVAGIVAAQATGEAVGVAPEARLLIAKVCGRKGCNRDAVAKALYWAVQENVDAVNMSLGGGGSVMETFMLKELDSKQIPAIAAIGNDGREAVPMPAGYPSVVAVGAVDMTGARASFSNWGPELDVMAPGVSIRSAVPMGTGRVPQAGFVTRDGALHDLPAVTFTGVAVSSVNQAAVFADFGTVEELAKVTATGKVLVVKRGNLPLLQKIKNAQAAGAAALVICNNDGALVSGTLTEDANDMKMPVIMVEKAAGEHLVASLIDGSAVSVQLDIQATDYAELSGTSMSSPYVTGVVALMKSVVPGITAFKIREILNQTSTPMVTEFPYQAGKGLVNTKAAVDGAYAVRKRYPTYPR